MYKKIKNIVPLFAYLYKPSAALGWDNAERKSLADKLKADAVIALALIHHLVIVANVPLRLM
jgi:hypothetical protein